MGGHRETSGSGDTLHPERLGSNTAAATLYPHLFTLSYCVWIFASRYLGGNSAKATRDLSVLFPPTSCGSMFTSE